MHWNFLSVHYLFSKMNKYKNYSLKYSIIHKKNEKFMKNMQKMFDNTKLKEYNRAIKIKSRVNSWKEKEKWKNF